MDSDLHEIIKQADLLIKEGKFKNAWNLLLPYQDDPAVRKRLIWLNEKRKRAAQASKVPNVRFNSRPRYRLYVLITVPVILGLSALAILGLSQRGNVLPTEAEETVEIAAVPTISVLATLQPTKIPPTEDLQEVSLQLQLRDWLARVEGVSQVLSFDVDLLDNESPLAYVEVNIKPGYNDTHIPDTIVQKLNGVLSTTTYADLTIIMNDETGVVQYSFNSASTSWDQIVLASTSSSSD